MPWKMSQTALPGPLRDSRHARAVEDGVLGYRETRKSAIVGSDPGSTGECRVRAFPGGQYRTLAAPKQPTTERMTP